MKNNKAILPCFLLFALTVVTKASSGRPVDVRLHGYVTDAVTKKPVSGVVVSVSAPGITGVTAAVTDADGYFSFYQLPAEQINLQFGKKGYVNYRRVNISVKEKNPVKITIEFTPENKEEEPDETEYPILRMLQFN
ncbi:MAG TPA: carboxypeptidase regulatory-like domain-containing protein [Puia sp.]|nr:carboxypeptidase regulatory-like domain-containing protein [Puia sp.]